MTRNETSTTPTAEFEKYFEYCVWENLELLLVTGFHCRPCYINHVVCLTYNFIQTLLIIVLNYLAIHAFWKSPQLKRKTSFFVVMVLSSNDLAAGLIAEPLFLLHLSREIRGNERCLNVMMSHLAIEILVSASVVTFLALNFEIYLSVIHPVFHREKVTNRRIFKIVLILWFVHSLRAYFFIHFIDQGTVKVIQTVFITLTMLAMVFMHTRIFLAVYNRRRIDVITGLANIKRRKAFLQGIRDAKTCFFVLFCTFSCYLPSAIEVSLTPKATFKAIILSSWSTTLIFSLSVLNSILFYWRNKLLRKEALRCLRIKFSH
ncbi:uncharacterized protein LOC114521638 [Dendronephthya gigantea]|uniref:uncharacterized protein LOC114521638 n=1 Tax=Dendronephthya gigantea TaxID=151771 RepID=UPI00106CEA72|nr:uncharacterized protein LOC114521638 [Dendronephthya gigantea]